MKRIYTLLTLCAMAFVAFAQDKPDNTIRPGGEYYLYNVYYNRVLGNNAANDGPSLSPFGTNADGGYVFIAEESTLDAGYYWLHQKGTTRYLQASNATGNTWSVWFAGNLNASYNSYEWKLTGGIEGQITSKRGENINADGNIWLAPDPDKEANTYVNVYYDKPKSARSVWQIVDARFPLEVGRLALYTDELDAAITKGEDVYENVIYGQKEEKEELAVALYNARSAREEASLADTETMLKARDALLAAIDNLQEGKYKILISGSSLGTGKAFTIGLKEFSLADEYKDGEVQMLVRNTVGTGAILYMGADYMRIGDDKFVAKIEAEKHSYQLAFDGSGIKVYIDGEEVGNAAQQTIPAYTSVGTKAEWTVFGETAIKSYTPEIVSYNYAFAPGEYYQENNKSKSTALKLVSSDITLSEPIDYHVLASSSTMQSSTINLADKGAWVIFDNVRPSDVISNYLPSIKINGRKASNGSNCRVAIYLQGAVVYPCSGSDIAMYGYSGEMYTGDEYQLKVGKNNDLGAAANNIQSFILKRGYMVCLATNADGSGYSRVYVADHEDKRIDVLPELLNKRVSFAYIRKWNWVSKKGWCSTEGTGAINTEGKLLGTTWFYTWGADRSTQTDMEYVPQKQHINWPSNSSLDQTNSTCMLGYNEPEHSEQHSDDCGKTISEWTATTHQPEFMSTGLRIGSPAPTDAGWLKNFIGHCDDMAYRCDFVAFHSYWGTNEAPNSDSWWSQLNSIYKSTGRPIWLTEWNNGASWTTESWPSSYGDKLTKQMNAIKSILSVLDNADFVERYALYNWDTYYRAAISWDSDKNSWWVTPCGEVYRDAHPSHAYKEKMQKVPVGWFPSMKTTGNAVSFDIKSVGRKINVTVTNTNGDFTATEELEYLDQETGTYKPFHELSNRSALDITTARPAETFLLDDCTHEALTAESLTLRLKITTLKGGVTYTEPYTLPLPAYIRNYYSNLVGIDMPASDDALRVSVVAGGVTINSSVPAKVDIYSSTGALVESVSCDGAQTVSLPSGVYVVGGKKVVVK